MASATVNGFASDPSFPAPSLSIMLILPLSVVPKTIPREGLLKETVIVSIPSSSESSTMVKVEVAVVSPDKIVKVVADIV